MHIHNFLSVSNNFSPIVLYQLHEWTSSHLSIVSRFCLRQFLRLFISFLVLAGPLLKNLIINYNFRSEGRARSPFLWPTVRLFWCLDPLAEEKVEEIEVQKNPLLRIAMLKLQPAKLREECPTSAHHKLSQLGDRMSNGSKELKQIRNNYLSTHGWVWKITSNKEEFSTLNQIIWPVHCPAVTEASG